MDALAQLKASLASRYAIDREIGRGGMATVYLARDVRHARNVALKVLNPELGAVLGVERFLSEIQVTANLQHPNLLPLFDSGEADGLLFYVMPFIEGESLRGRLRREKQLPVDEAIHLATAVASALDYAHRHGVIHRDLKPENILLHEGQPLVADFGIALAVSVAGGERITQTGISLGTPHYMSPEQATGDRPIDQRSDIYSLAAVLYEMLNGDPPHTASTAQAVIAKVLTDQPRSLRVMRPLVPPHVDAAIGRALEKLPADRFNSAQEFAAALQGKGVAIPPDLVTPGSIRGEARRRSRLRRILRSPELWAAAFVMAAAFAAWSWSGAARASAEAPVRFLLAFPSNERIYPGVGAGRTVAMSSDGRRVAYVSQVSGSAPRLVVRSLDDIAPHALAGTDGASQPGFSPDGKWILFVADQQLKKIPVEGGPVSLIADVGQTFGAHWGSGDRIVVSIGNQLAVVPATGAVQLRTFTPKDSSAATLRWPRMLADGKTVVYTRWTGGLNSAKIGVTSVETGETRLLGLDGSSPLGVIDGHLLYAGSTGALFAVPFDTKRLRATGNPMLVVERVAVGGTGAAIADVSASGSLIYQSGSASSFLVLYDTSGASRPLLPDTKGFLNPRFSPDGKRIAVTVAGAASTDVYVYSISSRTLTRLTTEGSVNDRPEWWPDGKRVVFRSERETGLTLHWQAADFSGPAELLLRVPGNNIWEGVPAPDGKTVAYRTGTIGSANIYIRSLSSRDTTTKPIATTSFTEWCPRFSPDGRFIAYSSDDSRILQVYVRAVEGAGGRTQVSVEGGSSPMWSHDGHTLYYINNQQLYAADVTTSPTFTVRARKKLFESDFDDRPGHANYDVSPDGKYFLMVKPSVSGDQVTVVHNWRTELQGKFRPASTAP